MITTALLISSFAFVGYSLKKIPELLLAMLKRHLIFKVTISQDDNMYNVISNWFNDNESENFANISVNLVRNDLGKWDIKYRHHSDSFISKYKGKKILIQKENKEAKANDGMLMSFFGVYEISGFMAKEQVLSFIKSIVDYDNFKDNKGRVSIKEWNYGHWRIVNTIEPKNTSEIFIDGMQELVKDIDSFIEKEEWYKSKGIPYKRGYFFDGKAGNGKSSIIQSIARRLNREIYMLSLSDVTSDRDLVERFSCVMPNSIIVMEDLDTHGNVVREREGKAETGEGKKGASLSALLNCLDGVYQKHGVIVMATSNHMDKLDSALVRAGRFDYKMTIDNPSKENVESYLSWFYGEKVELQNYEDGRIPMVDVQEMACVNGANGWEQAYQRRISA